MSNRFVIPGATKIQIQQQQHPLSKRNLLKQAKRKDRTSIKVLTKNNQTVSKQNITNNTLLNVNEAVQQNTVYQKITTIKKVARFLQIARSRVVRELKPEQISAQQFFYLENSNNQQNSQQYLLSWDNSLVTFLEIVFMATVIIGVWSYTYEIIFGPAFDSLNMARTTTMLMVYLIIICVSLNSELKTENLEILMKRKLIFFLYIKSYLIFDAFFIFGVIFSLFQVNGLFIVSRLLTLGAVPTISRLAKKIEDKYAVSVQVESLFRISRFILIILVFLHFLSLFLNAMSILQHQRGSFNTWIQKNNLQNSSDFDKYIDGYYWATTILSTVGFGDFTPANSTERGIMTLVMIICSLFFGYTINVIGNLIGILRESKAQFQSQTRRLNNYLERTTIPHNVKDKIKEYFYNQRQIKEAYDQDTQNFFLGKMTQQLRNQVKLKNNIKVVQNSKYLKLFTGQTQKKIAVALQKMMYAPDETVFNKQTEEIKLYLIQQGSFDQFCYDLPNSNLENEVKRISTYDKHDNTIGWSNLITGYKYNSSMKSNAYTIVYQLPQQQFLQIVKQDPIDLLKFSQMREKILQKKIQFKKDCFVCDRLTHNVVQCPKIHFIPRPLQLMIIFNKNNLRLLKNKRDVTYYRKGSKNKFNIQQMSCIVTSLNSIRSIAQTEEEATPQISFIIQSIMRSSNRQKSQQFERCRIQKIVNSIIKRQQKQKGLNIRKSKQRYNSAKNIQNSSIETNQFTEKLNGDQEKEFHLNQAHFEIVMLVEQATFFPDFCLQHILKTMKQDQQITKAQMKLFNNRKQMKSRFSKFIYKQKSM